MKNILFFIAATVLIGFAMKTAGKEDGSYLRDITMGHRTSHLAWAENLSSGKIKVLFIVPRKWGREVVEVAQRMAVDFAAVTTFNQETFAVENVYESAVDGTTVVEKTAELLQKLNKNYDLIVIGNFSFDKLPQEAQFRILTKVSEGTGLVMCQTKTKLKKIFSTPVGEAGKILSLSPLKGLPPTVDKASSNNLLETYSLGKGRIAVINYAANSLTAVNSFSMHWHAQYENNLVLVMRAMLWAAGKKTKITLSCPELATCPELDRKPLSIAIMAVGANDKTELKMRLRNERNIILTENKLNIANERAVFKSAALPAGRYFLDLIVDDGKDVDNIGYLCFDIKSPVGKTAVKTAKEQESFKPGETINGKFELEKPLQENGQLEIRIIDSPYGRVWFKKMLKVKPGQKNIEFKLENLQIPTLAGYLECILNTDGLELCRSRKLLFFPKRDKDIYIQIAWDAVPSTGGLATFYASQVVDELGWNAALCPPGKAGENARVAAIFNQRLIPYTIRIGLVPDPKTKALKQYSWWLKDKNALKNIKDQSFYNPEIQELWSKVIRERIENLSKYGPAIYSLGDENFFSYPNDFSPWGKIAFRNFLKTRYYGNINKLNSTWGSNYNSFNDISMSLEEASKNKNYPAWFDIRLFVEKEYADIHHFCAREIKKLDPEAIVGAEGSAPGNLEETISGLEYWGPYSDMVMDEVLRSIGGDKIRAMWWGGYLGGLHYGRNRLPTPLWKFLLTGIANGNAWYNSDLAQCDGMISTDMTYAGYLRGMVPLLNDLRFGIGQLLVETPLKNDGIAVLYSHASQSASLLDPRFVNPKDSESIFIEFCRSKGLNFDFLNRNMLAEKLKNYKILFLLGASAISKDEATAIKEFVERGGTAVADINPGILNGFLKPVTNNMLAPLFGKLSLAEIKNPELRKVSGILALNGRQIGFSAQKGLSTPGLPFMQVRKFGKGKAVLLNFSFSSAGNTACNGTSLAKFLEGLLMSEGIVPYVKLSGVGEEHLIIRVRESNGFKLVGILCAKKDIGKTAILSFSGIQHIYEIDKRFLKKGNSLKFKFDLPFKLFALYDKKQDAPEFSFSTGDILAGDTLHVDVSKIAEGSVLHVQLKGPDATMVPLRDKVLTVDKKINSFDFQFAYSDIPGLYKIIIRNINTGIQAVKEVKLK